MTLVSSLYKLYTNHDHWQVKGITDYPKFVLKVDVLCMMILVSLSILYF